MRLLVSVFTILTLLSGSAFALADSEPSITAGTALFIYRETMRELKRLKEKKNKDPKTTVKTPPFSVNGSVEHLTHITITSCSVQTNEGKAFESKDLGECLVQNYVEQYFKENDRMITINYTHDGIPAYLNLNWKPYYDGAKMEIKKFIADWKQLDLEEQMCEAHQKYSMVKDQAIGSIKYERAVKIAADSKTEMHSSLGRIKIVFEHPGDLQNILATSGLLSLFLNFDRISAANIDIVMDPDDFGNILAKVKFFENSLQVQMIETFIQFKISFKCHDFHVNVDPDEN